MMAQEGHKHQLLDICIFLQLTILFASNMQAELQNRLNFSSATIQVCSDNLRTHLSVKHLHNITFNGVLKYAIINCTGYESAGIEFIQITNLVITNFKLVGCGFKNEQSFSSVHILNCINVSVINVIISNGRGSGILFKDTVGNNAVNKSLFINNTIESEEKKAGGGGIQLLFNNDTNTSHYTIDHCSFEHNHVCKCGNCLNSHNSCQNSMDLPFGIGKGGGMLVSFRHSISKVSVNITNCLFEQNNAVWGGGMYILFGDNSRKHKVIVRDSVFKKNNCTYAGGGIDIGLIKNTTTNTFECFNCTFEENHAKSGGGTAIYASHKPQCINDDTNVIFINCKWLNNNAQYGAAVDLSQEHNIAIPIGELPEPTFRNCTFMNNTVKVSTDKFHQETRYEHGKGSFLVNDFTVHFQEYTLFHSNNGSGIYATSSYLLFESESVTRFIENSGTDGGAIAIIGLSALVLEDYTSLIFTNNTAMNSGGAIYYFSLDHHDYVFSKHCFIRPTDFDNNSPNVTFHFSGNSVFTDPEVDRNTDIKGNSIYATSIIPCLKFCNLSTANITEESAFQCIGNFQFEDHDPRVSTSGAYFAVMNKDIVHQALEVIPGQQVHLPFVLKDDFNQNVTGEFRVTVDNNRIRPRNKNVHVSDNKLELYGEPGNKGILTLTTIDLHEMSISFKIEMQDCPPLFFLNTDITFSHDIDKCVCSISSYTDAFFLYKCYSGHAAIRHGYWTGYKDKTLLHSYCPIKYCFNGQHNQRYHNLTKSASKQNLDDKVCGDSRTGLVCGNCRQNHSVYYHNDYYLCKWNHLCELGWVFYILSELLPLTFLFIAVMVLNIRFTSGAMNGFILFAQVFDSISDVGEGIILYPKTVYILKTIARAIYKFFNFDFFSINQLSFCLWKGATTLDMLAFKFLTVAYAFFLVFITIWLMDCFRKHFCSRKHTITGSVTHGLSAFLVMVYAQCMIVSFKILQFVNLYAPTTGTTSSKHTVVFYQGTIAYFSPKHLLYALPALVCIMTIVTIPPTVLLVYPACNKLLSCLRLDSWTIITCISQKIPITRAKPMIDTFQGCFKDQYRYFAGLYFVYRIAFIACTLATRLTLVYMILQLLLITALLLHAVTWPYEKQWHNTTDGLIIFNLAVVNGLSMFSYTYAQYGSKYQRYINIASYIQLPFIYAPLVYILIYTGWIITGKLKALFKDNSDMSSDNWRNDELPARLEGIQDLSDTESETDYHLLDQGFELQKL